MLSNFRSMYFLSFSEAAIIAASCFILEFSRGSGRPPHTELCSSQVAGQLQEVECKTSYFFFSLKDGQELQIVYV